MPELSVLTPIHSNSAPSITQSILSSHLSSNPIIHHLSSSASRLELQQQAKALTLTQENNVLTTEIINENVMDEVENDASAIRGSHTDNTTYSQATSTTSTRKTSEATQWPSESTILVAVRVRPFSPAEQAQRPQTPTNKFNLSADASLSNGFGNVSSRSDHTNSSASTTKSSAGLRKVVDVLDDNVLVFDPPDAESISKYKRALLPVQAYRRFKDMRYAFDRVFDEDSQQQEVFENTTKHLIDGVLGGYNGTLFAYGATGCGKTHTISGTPEKPGIIFLTMQELYVRIKELEDEKTIEISLSYLEVYNEAIRDLLAKPTPDTVKPQALHLREDSSKRVTIAGLSEHHPKGMDELMELVFKGNENRTISPTEANATSSRSHAVLQINICQRLRTADISEDFTMATLSLIDLAGSERASATKNRGSRLMEGANINKSLLALGNCINALCENRPKSHIPYRDSKLTRLLKFSLGGNCKTVMIACVSPSSRHYEETHNTLKYANRAKNIKTKVTKNTMNVDRHVSEYVQAIYELRQEVAELKSRLKNQAKGEGFEKAQQKQEILGRAFDDTIRKMRATFQTARSQELTYAQFQSQLFIASARLSGLYRWRAGFEEASQAAKRQSEKLEQAMESVDDAEAAEQVNKLNSSLNASSSYTNMVDQLISDLIEQTVRLTKQMQEHEDALKMYAVSIQSMEQKDNPILNSGFPYQRLYELEKKCQALESHNKILTTKLELSDKSLSDQFLATDNFMELSARSLVGLRSEIEAVEQAGMATKTLNDIYMASITSFTDMTKQIGSSISGEYSAWNLRLNYSINGSGEDLAPGSPFKRDDSSTSVGLNGSKIMSILPEVPQTPVKRQTTSHVLPNLSMDTVDTSVAIGTSGLFGNQSPIRMYQEYPQLGSPQNPFQVPPLPIKGNIAPRRRSMPFAGALFSPKRRRPRGGLRQPRLTPIPSKRHVHFSLDVVDEDEERYSTGLLDPLLPSVIRPTPFPSLSSSHLKTHGSLPRAGGPSSMSFAPLASRLGKAGGAKRLVPALIPVSSKSGVVLNGQGGARRVVASSSTGTSIGTSIGISSTNNDLSSGFPITKGKVLKGAQRVVPSTPGDSKPTAPSSTLPSLPKQGVRKVIRLSGDTQASGSSNFPSPPKLGGAQRVVRRISESHASAPSTLSSLPSRGVQRVARPPNDPASSSSSSSPPTKRSRPMENDLQLERDGKRLRMSIGVPSVAPALPLTAATTARIKRRLSLPQQLNH